MLWSAQGYFRSKNCIRELEAALEANKPRVLVHEMDEGKGGLPLRDAIAAGTFADFARDFRANYLD